MSACRAKMRRPEDYCYNGVTASKPDDHLCGIHWQKKFGHIWLTQNNNYDLPRICRNCGRAEQVRYSESFAYCEKPFKPDLPMFTLEERLMVIRARHSSVKLAEMTSCEQKLAHWMARAKIVERQLEENFYQD